MSIFTLLLSATHCQALKKNQRGGSTLSEGMIRRLRRFLRCYGKLICVNLRNLRMKGRQGLHISPFKYEKVRSTTALSRVAQNKRETPVANVLVTGSLVKGRFYISELKKLPGDYSSLFVEVKERIRSAQYAALKAANKELVGLYRDIGKTIAER